MKKLTFQQSALLMGGGVIVGATLLQLFFLGPVNQAIEERDTLIYEERVHIEIAKLQQQNAAVSKAEYDRLQSTSTQLAGFFVDEDHLLDFISELEGAAATTNVTQELQNLRAPNDKETSSTITILATGGFDALMAFVRAVESLQAYVLIDRMTFATSVDSASLLTLTINARIFWL